MTLVVDTSVAVKFVVDEQGSDAADEILAGSEPLIAPDWLLAEMANALWNKVRLAHLLESDARNALEKAPQFFTRFEPAHLLLDRAFDFAFRLRHPVYDCFYLALAVEEDCRMITADKAFKKSAERGGYGDRVDLLEYQAWPG
jgi:predicted nucleic acid-binding protein